MFTFENQSAESLRCLRKGIKKLEQHLVDKGISPSIIHQIVNYTTIIDDFKNIIINVIQLFG